MENLIDKWATIPLTELRQKALNTYVHPDDLESLDQLEQPVNLIIGCEDDYIKLAINSGVSIRLKQIIVKESRKPEYFINEKVKTVNSKGFLEFGVIKDYYWHSNDSKYVYLLEVNGKMKSRRYHAEDLSLMI
ncbi:hypothetical protein L3C95_30895 [Chitinophaga filiformis]|uniref:hypothetical protein n=1 Tax=Chitinophaga filiformis TaxID=104663 RepID=UPI001F1E4667|nr:hypothetical protein [Chitinophaga filiformis]MCF6407343.1 hypothetical protein [Chitinophaga filiformis]